MSRADAVELILLALHQAGVTSTTAAEAVRAAGIETQEIAAAVHVITAKMMGTAGNRRQGFES